MDGFGGSGPDGPTIIGVCDEGALSGIVTEGVDVVEEDVETPLIAGVVIVTVVVAAIATMLLPDLALLTEATSSAASAPFTPSAAITMTPNTSRSAVLCGCLRKHRQLERDVSWRPEEGMSRTHGRLRVATVSHRGIDDSVGLLRSQVENAWMYAALADAEPWLLSVQRNDATRMTWMNVGRLRNAGLIRKWPFWNSVSSITIMHFKAVTRLRVRLAVVPFVEEDTAMKEFGA